MINVEKLRHLGPFTQQAHKLNDGSHIVHFYDQAKTLIDAVCDFVVPSLTRGEGIILIATPENRRAIKKALERRSIDIAMTRATGQLLIMDAFETLEKFMVNGMPQAMKFENVMGGVLEKMQSKFPKVRAYGEMVNILWHQDNIEATIQLEGYWNLLAKSYQFSLFCGYHVTEENKIKNGLSLNEVCCTHSHVICPAGDLKVIC
ncbi:MAG: MEDS domain-containing protein [Bdellovibrionales bacterium]|nr:MEDS domain-containing protein [Bdellovibrionales bacterium]